MARISGVNIPTNKKINIALTYIFGIGNKVAGDICSQASIDITKRVSELNDDELNVIRDLIDQKHTVEGDLRRKISLDINILYLNIIIFNIKYNIITKSGKGPL